MRFAYSPLSSVINYRRGGAHPPLVGVSRRAELGLGAGGGRASLQVPIQGHGAEARMGTLAAFGADLPAG